MGKETYIELRENLKYIYAVVNELINSHENREKALEYKNTDEFMDEVVQKLGEVSSILQIDIHRLDMIFSVENIAQKTDRQSPQPQDSKNTGR